MPKLVLASASPRRRRLLPLLELPFDVAVSDVEDDLEMSDSSPSSSPAHAAASLAAAKASHVAGELGTGDTLVLGFDTLVVIDGSVLGKPRDAAEARAMLGRLSGRTHEVITGVAAIDEAGAQESFTHATPVSMRQLSSGDIERWLVGDEVLGCAGAYNIERHLGSVALDQCFQNVAGLPLCHTYVMLAERFGLEPARPDKACNSARRVECELARGLFG